MRVRAPARGMFVAALLLAGCGADDEPSSPVAPAERQAPAKTPRTVPEAPAPEPLEDAEPLPSADVARERTRAVRRASLRLRRQAARAERAAAERAAAAVARAGGLTDVEVDGRTVRGNGACGTSAAALRRQLREVLKGARLRLVSECALEPPDGRGRVLLERRGRGSGATREIDVGAGRWALEYAATGDVLQIAVEREAGLAGPPVIRPRGDLTGRRVYREGGPIRLHVTGDGRWLVRIRRLSRSSRG